MISTIALFALLMASGWLVFVGVLCLLRPQAARAALARMGSTMTIQLGEHALRGLGGLALVLRAADSKAPLLFTIAGWFIVATSVMIVLAPRQWHHSFALWWADRIPDVAWPVIALISFALAGLLAYAAI